MARAWQATSTRSPSSRRRGWSPTFRACRSGRWPGRSGMPSMPLATAAGDAEPVLPPVLIELAGFVATHYVVPLDEVIRAIVPPRVRAVVRRSVKRRRQSRILRQATGTPSAVDVQLEPAQQAAKERIAIA